MSGSDVKEPFRLDDEGEELWLKYYPEHWRKLQDAIGKRLSSAAEIIIAIAETWNLLNCGLEFKKISLREFRLIKST